MQQQAQITIAPDRLEIKDLTVMDHPTVTYISCFEPQRRADAIINAIQLGARIATFANDRMGATEICGAIEASANSAQQILSSIAKATNDRIDDTLKSIFGKDGIVQKNVKEELAVLERELDFKLDPEKKTSITRKIEKALSSKVTGILGDVRRELNLADPKSPLGLLRAELDVKHQALDEKINQLITQQTVKLAVGVERVRGTAKGVAFEDALFGVLAELCRHRRDQLDRTGTEAGLNGRRRCGDFVIEINSSDARGCGLKIALEAKNDQTKQRELIRELDDAIDNRGALFGIGISTSPSLFPPGAPPIAFVGDDKILVAIPDYDGVNGTFDNIFVEVALTVGRHLAIALREGEPQQVNLPMLNEVVTNAINMLTRFSEVKRRLTSIVNSANEAGTLVDSIRSEVRDALQAIRDTFADALSGEGQHHARNLKSA